MGATLTFCIALCASPISTYDVPENTTRGRETRVCGWRVELCATQTGLAQRVVKEASILTAFHQSQKTRGQEEPRPTPPVLAAGSRAPQIECAGTRASPGLPCTRAPKAEAPPSPPIKVDQGRAASASLDPSSALAETASQRNPDTNISRELQKPSAEPPHGVGAPCPPGVHGANPFKTLRVGSVPVSPRAVAGGGPLSDGLPLACFLADPCRWLYLPSMAIRGSESLNALKQKSTLVPAGKRCRVGSAAGEQLCSG